MDKDQIEDFYSIIYEILRYLKAILGNLTIIIILCIFLIINTCE